MGRVTAMIGALALVVAACSGSVAPTATPAPVTPGLTATPAPVTPAPTTTPLVLPAALTWDGATCTYAGPSVVPRGSVVSFTLSNDPALTGAKRAELLIGPALAGTTWEQVVAYANTHKASEPAPWAYMPDGVGIMESAILSPDQAAHGGSLPMAMTRSIYFVMCAVGPDPDKAYPAIMLKVLDS